MNQDSLICSVMQPAHQPWLGYFDLIDTADTFVFYDDVQFVKQGRETRNVIKTSNGVIYISVPTVKSNLGTPINQILLDNRKPWQKKQLKTLFYTYQKTDFFSEVYPFFEQIYNTEYQFLFELNINIIKSISKKIGINTQFVKSSTLKPSDKIKDARLVDICNELKCNTYLSTIGSSSYIEKNSEGGAFTKNNIKLLYHNYKHPVYNQLFKDFEPYMSIVDLLFNVGFENSLSIIRKGRNPFFNSKDVTNES